MAHTFSTASVMKMVEIFDRNIVNIWTELDKYVKSGEAFDWLRFSLSSEMM